MMKRSTYRFDVRKWLADRPTFNMLASRGFKVMSDLDLQDRQSLVLEIFKQNDLDFFKDLIENGFVFNKHTTLLFAINFLREDDCAIIRFLVGNGSPVNRPEPKEPPKKETATPTQISRQPSPLIVAVKKGFPAIAELLLQHEAKLGEEELKEIGESHNFAFVEVLRKLDIDLNMGNAEILRAALVVKRFCSRRTNKTKQVGMISALLEAGADPNELDEEEYNCGHFFVKNTDPHSTPKEQKEETIDLLLSKGLEINEQTLEGETMLHLAGSSDNEMIEILLQRGADPSIESESGVASIYLLEDAIRMGEHCYFETFGDLLDLFLKNNVDLNIQDEQEETILDKLIERCWINWYKNPIQILLNKVEMEAPEKWTCTDPCMHFECIFPLVQAGYEFDDYTGFIDVVAQVESSTFDLGEVLACVNPMYDKETLDWCYQDWYDGVYYSRVHSLRSLAIHAVRKHILKVNGSTSLLPRARKLPLPPNLVDLVTLECLSEVSLELIYGREEEEPEEEDLVSIFKKIQDTNIDHLLADEHNQWKLPHFH